MSLHTGKHEATVDHRDRMFRDYVDTDKIDLSSPPPNPRELGHADRMPQPRLMLGNGPDDSVRPGFEGAGDCVFAATTNYLRLAHAISGKGLFPADGSTAIANYSAFTGFKIDDPSTDQGTSMRDWMNQWRKTGYRDANGVYHQIGGYAVLDPSNVNELLWANYLSDMGVPIGIKFPTYAMQTFDTSTPWQAEPNPQYEGGHAILVDYRQATFRVESWAQDKPTWLNFIEQNMDEGYVPFDADGLVNGLSLEGFDSQQLLSDISAL